jgi:hypothetical protein
LNDLKLLFDIRIEKTIEKKSVRTLLPSSQVGYFIPVQDVASGTKLIYVADLRINGCEKEARICDRTITDVTWTIIPSQANACIYFLSLAFTLGGAFWW